MDNHLAILNEILQFLRRFQRAEHLVQESLTFIAQLTGWAGIALLSLDHETGSVHVTASTGTFAPPLDAVAPADQPMVVTALQTKFLHRLSHGCLLPRGVSIFSASAGQANVAGIAMHIGGPFLKDEVEVVILPVKGNQNGGRDEFLPADDLILIDNCLQQAVHSVSI